MKNKDLKLTFTKVPRSLSQVVFKRIGSFMEHFQREKMVEAQVLDYRTDFGLKELCMSCYTQGLLDAQQLKPDQNG